MGYLRLGMEKDGIDMIDKSWSGDQYNVRAYNTRRLFKETIPKEGNVIFTAWLCAIMAKRQPEPKWRSSSQKNTASPSA